MARAIVSHTIPPELDALEAEIMKMRTVGELSAEQETEIIKRELDVLKRYCDKLSNIQEENEQLKRELEHMKSGGGGGSYPAGEFLYMRSTETKQGMSTFS